MSAVARRSARGVRELLAQGKMPSEPMPRAEGTLAVRQCVGIAWSVCARSRALVQPTGLATTISVQLSPSPIGRYFRAAGHAVHERDGVCWVEIGKLSVIAVPATQPIDVSPAAVDDVLRATGRLAATYVSAAGQGVPAAAWWVRDANYGLESVQRQFRQNLRRGQDHVTVRRLEGDELRRLGLAVHCETIAARQGPAPPTTRPDGWNRFCDVLADDERFDAVGCFVDGILAAYIVSLTTDGQCLGLVAYCAPRFEAARPAHWLYHRFAAEMIRRPGVRGVTVGRQLIPARPSLDSFKRHAGYVPEPIFVAAVLHPRWRVGLELAPVRGLLRRAGRVLGRRAGPLENVTLLDAAVETRQIRRVGDRAAN